jgi:MFS family permease
MSGFLLFAAGLAVTVELAGPTSHWYDLLPGYLIIGLGIGCTMSPMQTIATRNVDPRMAGAASGVLNTVRQTGSALGSAVVLAVLQNRVAAHDTFVTAMRAAIAAPIAVLILAAVLCLGIQGARRPQPSPSEPHAAKASATEA